MRPTIEETMLATAYTWAKRATCSRLQVGAVLAQGDHPVAIGYNGAAKGMPHCDHSDGLPCKTAVHAETNALLDAARRGVVVAGATLYLTHLPCPACAGNLINAGVKRVVYAELYRETAGESALVRAGIQVHQHVYKFLPYAVR